MTCGTSGGDKEIGAGGWCSTSGAVAGRNSKCSQSLVQSALEGAALLVAGTGRLRDRYSSLCRQYSVGCWCCGDGGTILGQHTAAGSQGLRGLDANSEHVRIDLKFGILKWPFVALDFGS